MFNRKSKGKATNGISFQIRNIPPKDWKKFKIRMLQDDMKTINDVFLLLISQYAEGKAEAND